MDNSEYYITAVTAHHQTIFQPCLGWGKPLPIFLMLKKNLETILSSPASTFSVFFFFF